MMDFWLFAAILFLSWPWIREARAARQNARTVRRESAFIDVEWELFRNG